MAIGCVLLILVGFLLEADCPVSPMCVTMHRQPNQPFQHIPQIEEHIRHFLHLHGVDFLVLQGHARYPRHPSGEENPKEIDGSKSLGRENVISDYLHHVFIFNVPLSLYKAPECKPEEDVGRPDILTLSTPSLPYCAIKEVSFL